MESFVWCILQVTLLALVAAAVYLVVRGLRAGGLVAMLVAALAGIALLTLACLSPWPRWNWPSATDWGRGWGEQPPTASAPTAGPKQSNPAEPSPGPRLGGASPPAPQPGPAGSASPSFDVAAAGKALAATRPTRHYLVFAAWAVSGLGLCRFAVGVLSLRRIRRESVELADERLRTLMEELCRQMGIRWPVDLRESPWMGVAATMGWRRPLVLLPAGWQAWPADQRRAALAHELAHVRLRHFPTWLGCQLSLVAHFYHPLVHWLCRRLRLEQEIAADALAAAVFADRRRYAAALAGLALQSSRPPYAIAPLGLFMSRPLLMRRIAMLRQTEKSGIRPSTWRRHLLPLAIVAAAIAAAGLRASADAEAAAQLPGPADPNHSSRVLALLQVSRDRPMPLGRQEDGMTDAAWKLFCNSQLAFLRSDFLLQAALRNPSVAALPIVKEQARPIAWLQQSLQVGFIGDSELMYVMMHSRPNEADQARQLVDAVVQAYKNEVLFRDDQRRLVTRDVLAKSCARLNRELEDKTQRYYDLALALGSAEAGGAQIEQQLQMKRLDRVENEIMKLEGESWQLRVGAKAGDEKIVAERLEVYAERLAGLQKDRAELVEAIRQANQSSVSLTLLRRELDQLQRISDDMSMKLETLEIEAFLPARIDQLHQAIVTEIEPPR